MGRSLSTPGLVESKGRIPIEEMTLATSSVNGDAVCAIAGRDSPVASTSGASSSGAEGDVAARRAALLMGPCLHSFPPSLSRLGQRTTESLPSGTQQLLSPSGLSASLEVSPATECTGLSPASTSDHVALLPVPMATTTPSPHQSSPQHEILVAEIKRLRERLVTLETENATMSYKLSQQQWEMAHRLAEIEMHIGTSADGAANGDDNNERNRESII